MQRERSNDAAAEVAMGPGPFEEIKRVLALAVKLAVEVQPLNDEVSTQHFSLEGATEALDQNSEDRDVVT